MFDVMSVTAADVSGLISVPASNFNCTKGHTNIRRLGGQRHRNGWHLVQRQGQTITSLQGRMMLDSQLKAWPL